MAQAEGIEVNYQKPSLKQDELEFLRFFDSETMSVHLKEGQKPMAKRGKPGSFILQEIEDKSLSHDYLKGITAQILDLARLNNKTNIEISKPGATVVQYNDYRIAMSCQN